METRFGSTLMPGLRSYFVSRLAVLCTCTCTCTCILGLSKAVDQVALI